MADRIVINVKPYQGEYLFDIGEEPLTVLEWRWVKKLSGYLPMTIDDGLRGGDPDLFLAFAVVALTRAGKVDQRSALEAADTLAQAPFDGTAIQYVAVEEEGDADGPPAVTEEPPTSSGTSSASTSENSENGPSSTGHPDSERSATSGRLTSVG